MVYVLSGSWKIICKIFVRGGGFPVDALPISINRVDSVSAKQNYFTILSYWDMLWMSASAGTFGYYLSFKI